METHLPLPRTEQTSSFFHQIFIKTRSCTWQTTFQSQETDSACGKAWRTPGVCGVFLDKQWIPVYSGWLCTDWWRATSSAGPHWRLCQHCNPGCATRCWHFTCRDSRLTNIFYYLLAPRPSPPPPCQPHPSPSVLKGLLAAHEAELEVRRAGPDPLVSPRLKGSDYMEN